MPNPLLENFVLPPFSRIAPEHVKPAVERMIGDNKEAIRLRLDQAGPYTWSNLVEPLELMDDRLNKGWSPVSHLNAVMNSEALRDAFNECLPLLSEYATEVGQNEGLYAAYRDLANSPEFEALDLAQKRIIENALRDFRLSGVSLPAEQKVRFKEIAQELSKLSSQYQDNVLDATQGWQRHVEDEAMLKGIPESAIAMAAEVARAQGLSGWVFNLEFPSYIAVMTYADHRQLREDFYTAYSTRASDQGPTARRWDNTEIMERILALRHEEARLLGYENFAELSLATKMAPSVEAVESFLIDLADRSLPSARDDLQALKAFAQEELSIAEPESWDLTYASEKLRQAHYDISQEEVRPYFPVPRVLEGLFRIIERLFGVVVTPISGVDVWHEDVRYFEIRDADGVRGGFYLDLYARPKKRGGAWMDECTTRYRVGARLQLPVAYLTCNFTPPLGDRPALLRHDEVETLFHEFGHGLQHMLTRVDHLGVSGIHGVEWDAVELPSQFMENFCWNSETLALMSGHFETGMPLPESLLTKMLAARNFQSGMQMLRQVEFALFDIRMHRQYDPAEGGRVYAILDEVRDRVAVVRPPAFNRFPHSFSHVFAGGYAAGYYSYKWAEVLSSDAYSLFEEKGVLDPKTGQSFLSEILEKGGSEGAMDLFVAFRGREPSIEPLLRHSGLADAA